MSLSAEGPGQGAAGEGREGCRGSALRASERSTGWCPSAGFWPRPCTSGMPPRTTCSPAGSMSTAPPSAVPSGRFDPCSPSEDAPSARSAAADPGRGHRPPRCRREDVASRLSTTRPGRAGRCRGVSPALECVQPTCCSGLRVSQRADSVCWVAQAPTATLFRPPRAAARPRPAPHEGAHGSRRSAAASRSTTPSDSPPGRSLPGPSADASAGRGGHRRSATVTSPAGHVAGGAALRALRGGAVVILCRVGRMGLCVRWCGPVPGCG